MSKAEEASNPISTPTLDRPVRLAVLLSGGGSTLQNLIDRIEEGRLQAEIAVVIASKEGIKGIERAREAKLDTVIIARKRYADASSFNDALHGELESHDFDIVVLAGFLSPIQLRKLKFWQIINVHPSLIPAFCGKGFYGERVHRAVLEAGIKISGCTVHFVDDEYDHGPVILQKAVEVRDADDVATLAARVISAERELYPQAIELWAQGKLMIEGRRVQILDKGR